RHASWQKSTAHSGSRHANSKSASTASSSARASPTECVFSLRTRQIEPGARAVEHATPAECGLLKGDAHDARLLDTHLVIDRTNGPTARLDCSLVCDQACPSDPRDRTQARDPGHHDDPPTREAQP